jgi:signal transduction histidine kinase
MATAEHLAIPHPVDELVTETVVAPRPILVVDDVPANLLAMEVALAPLDRAVDCVASGRAALGRLLDQDYSLILLDVQMPEMDGFETAAMIRARRRTRHTPIIFVTAHQTEPALVRRAYQLGAVDFLFKPIEPDILLAKASVFVTLQTQADALAEARLRRDFDAARRDFERSLHQHQLDRFAEEDRRKDRFLAMLSHELRTPLAPIRTAIDLAQRDPAHGLTPKMLQILDRQTAQLARLVDDLLDLSRIKSDKLELRRETVDLRAIVDTAISTVAQAIEGQHDIVVEVPERPVLVDVDPARIEQILANLLGNAVRYMETGGRVEVSCEVTGDRVKILVCDDGIGIDPAQLENVFEMFVQEGVGNDSPGGLGLGLALSRRLAEMHGGTLTAESSGRNCGSTFILTIPAAAAPALDVAPQLAEASRGQPLRLVVVDDNDDLRDLLSALLTKQGHQVTVAGDGHTALAMIRASPPDVAIVDLGLPDIDGFELIRELRASCPRLATRLIALTGHGQPADIDRTRAAGFHEHLVKPVSSERLLAMLRDRAAP